MEKRETTRRRVFKSGQIVFNNGYCSIDCTVRFVSEMGAKLTMETTVGVPSEFTLIFDNLSRSCHVQWRKIRELGVSFLAQD